MYCQGCGSVAGDVRWVAGRDTGCRRCGCVAKGAGGSPRVWVGHRGVRWATGCETGYRGCRCVAKGVGALPRVWLHRQRCGVGSGCKQGGQDGGDLFSTSRYEERQYVRC